MLFKKSAINLNNLNFNSKSEAKTLIYRRFKQFKNRITDFIPFYSVCILTASQPTAALRGSKNRWVFIQSDYSFPVNTAVETPVNTPTFVRAFLIFLII